MAELLFKGLEEEIYTGTHDGDIVGMSHLVAADLPEFMVEPDCRNTEYATHPYQCYDRIKQEVLSFRCQLIRYLRSHGDYTLIPGATLSLGDSTKFVRSNPDNIYHDYIEKTYGTDVVTTSAHLNIGIENQEDIIRAVRTVRMEAFAWLALTASSPFLDNQATGYHSTRWSKFPHTPKRVPLFKDRSEYIHYVEDQIEKGVMRNIRHLWTAVRPNGIGVPHEINRLELRICDRIDKTCSMMGVTALLEARVHQILQDPEIDVLKQAPFKEDALLDIIEENEEAVALNSLNAVITDWQSGNQMTAAEWIQSQLSGLKETAKNVGFEKWLEPVDKILEEGNVAQQWLRRHDAGESIRDIIKSAIVEIEKSEIENPCC